MRVPAVCLSSLLCLCAMAVQANPEQDLWPTIERVDPKVPSLGDAIGEHQLGDFIHFHAVVVPCMHVSERDSSAPCSDTAPPNATRFGNNLSPESIYVELGSADHPTVNRVWVISGRITQLVPLVVSAEAAWQERTPVTERALVEPEYLYHGCGCPDCPYGPSGCCVECYDSPQSDPLDAIVNPP